MEGYVIGFFSMSAILFISMITSLFFLAIRDRAE